MYKQYCSHFLEHVAVTRKVTHAMTYNWVVKGKSVGCANALYIVVGNI
jgi:hypothetical protein